MDREAYKIFATLEHRHWWFLGRRKLYGALLRDVLTRDRGAPPADLTVLDVGCGTGGFLGELGRLGRVVGLEMESAAIEHCRGQGFTDTQGRTQVAPATSLYRHDTESLLGPRGKVPGKIDSR